MSSVVLTTINAKYIHAALGLRYLFANMGELQQQTRIMEFTIDQRAIDIAESILADEPDIVGLGVYIWNVDISTEVAALLKKIRPDVAIVLGGPEVSYEQDDQPLVQNADHIICGMGDKTFSSLCQQLLEHKGPAEKLIPSEELDIKQIQFPYRYYSEEDIDRRLIYVEASRGCPFKCEFCLSALDKTAWPFDLNNFLEQMDMLYKRGARHFRFVDRTFNLKTSSTVQILEFFLEKLNEELFLHFELIPDRLPDRVKRLLPNFPAGSLQFEVGVQTFTPSVQSLISRRQDNHKTKENLNWLRQHTHAHIHTDLIFGLPGESLQSFAQSFDELVALDPQEIQLGILKRLRGSPIIRHSQTFDLRFNPNAPYNILSTDRIDFTTMQRVNRFARYWDMIVNSGRFVHTRSILLGDQPFNRFLKLSDWLYSNTQQTHRIALTRLFDLVEKGAEEALCIPRAAIAPAIQKDRGIVQKIQLTNRQRKSQDNSHQHRKRQVRHLRAVQ